MSEVDTNPKPSTDNPGTVGDEALAAAADDTSNDVTNEAKTDDVTAKGPEAVQEGGEQTAVSDPGSRRSPEGPNNGPKNGEVSTSDGAVPASGADGADVQGSAETETGKPDASETRQEGGADGKGQSVSETAGGRETDKTPSAEGEGATDGTDVSARQVEGAETSAEGQKTGDGTEQTADRPAADDPGQDGEGRNEGQQPPATPTFSDDAGEQDAKDSGAGDAQAQRQPAEGDVANTAADDVESAQSPPLTASAAAQLTKRLTNTPADGNLPKPQTAHLPAIARGQARAQQMTSAITDAIKNEVLPPPRQPIRYRRPPKYVRLATVTVSPAR
ncbi:hypothetical protein BaRGS_00038309 [Batillaria attramentaria]|uniref:Uncharacterized protein n=1 Tax=Batillaria attramentaria TaxID=370345 RepID=A0ABD0J6Q8_9CAEN